MYSAVPPRGTVARKIALFQLPQTDVNACPTKLERKDGIKRKKSGRAKPMDDMELRDSSSACVASSVVSSDSCYGGSLPGEGQGWKSTPTTDYLHLISNIGNQRRLKDCYQTLTPSRRPSGILRLQLFEFSDHEESQDDARTQVPENIGAVVADTYYEELDDAAKGIEPRKYEDEERPPSPPPYESIYAEPIYGDTGSNESSSYWSPSSSIYSSGPTSHSVLLNNTSVTPSSSQRLPLAPFDRNSPQLPPLPNPSSQNKFTSIAKSAGRKLAKKLDIIRRFSRASSMDRSMSLTPSPVPLSFPSPSPLRSNHATSLYNLSQSSNISGVTDNTVTAEINNVTKMKRPLSRPRIPPPEPPPPNISTLDRKASLQSTNGRSARTQKFKNGGMLDVNRNSAEKCHPDLEERNNFDADDFEDSDFCDSDSELIRNFVAAVQPIYSMEEEPLYQYYTYGISLQPEDDYQPVIPKNLGLTLEMLIPRQGQRTLWCQIPEVTTSGILDILSDKQKQLQESIFEILTSEVSYLKSLDVLISLFYENQDLQHLLSETDRAALFGNIKAVKEASSSFLKELLGRWEESWYIHDVGNLIRLNAENKFSVYVDYCRNKPYQDRTVGRLRSSCDEFVNVVKSIEDDRKCENLRMDSFLMLPMQRITRLPLLVNAIIQRTPHAKEKSECEEALKSLTDLVIECNEAARESQDLEETGRILEKLEFRNGLFPLRNPGQFLLKGDFMKNPFDSSRGAARINWTFQKSRRTYYCVILFSQQLFITKKRTSGKLEVVDTASPMDTYVKVLPTLEGISTEYQHYFMLHFDGRDTVYFLAGRTHSEVDRWRLKLDHVRALKDYRVTAIFDYQAEREDELSFETGEIIQVSQKQPDGWFYGSKENGDEGWFPGNYAE